MVKCRFGEGRGEKERAGAREREGGSGKGRNGEREGETLMKLDIQGRETKMECVRENEYIQRDTEYRVNTHTRARAHTHTHTHTHTHARKYGVRASAWKKIAAARRAGTHGNR